MTAIFTTKTKIVHGVYAKQGEEHAEHHIVWITLYNSLLVFTSVYLKLTKFHAGMWASVVVGMCVL